MPYKFLKPEITNVWKATWNTIKTRWQFLAIVLLSVSVAMFLFWLLSERFDNQSINYSAKREEGSLFLVLLPFIAILYYIRATSEEIRGNFWRRFAEINGWQYKSYGDPDKESGIMFRQGNSGIGDISHIIEGSIDDRQFRIFSYQFSIGSGKHKKTYRYTVFAFKFNGTFPHIYLNSKINFYGVSTGEKIPLPSEFEEKFTLSAPREYETEALEIFTTDVLANLLDNGFSHDVEFVDQEVLIFVNTAISDAEELEEEFNRALKLEDLLDEKLDKFKFEKIGDMPSTL